MLIVLSLIAFFVRAYMDSKEGETIIETSSSLDKILDLHDLETFEYPYSAVATVKNEKGKELYHIKYNASIVMAVDLSKVNTDIFEEDKKIVITVPDAEIKSYNIDYGNLQYMKEEKYNSDNIINEARNAVKEDLDIRLSDEKQEMFAIAKENARLYLEAWTKPIVDQFYSEYSLEIN